MCKWKKWMSLVLATAMIGTLTACGGSGGEKDAAAQEPAQTQTEKPADAAEAPNDTAASGEKVKLNMLFNDTDENVQAEMKYVMEHLPEVLPNVEVCLLYTSDICTTTTSRPTR